MQTNFAPISAVLGDGRRVAIREVRPEDASAFAAAFARLSSATRYNRFMGAVRELPASVLERAVSPKSGDLALVALADDHAGAPIVGGARYFVEATGETCEFAVTVDDEWQRTGLASQLVQALVGEARRRGLKAVRGYVLAANAPMLALAQRLGFEVVASSEGPSVRLVTLELARG